MIDASLEIIKGAFSADYYLQEYPDLQMPSTSAFDHYCQVGWIEGRNPSPYFDTVTYLQMHDDVRRSGVNPLFHYLHYGRKEGRVIVPSVTPSARSELLFGYAIGDWVAAIRDFVDVDFYTSHLPAKFPPSLNPVAHFAFRGWREALNPSASLPIAALVERFRHSATLLVNPLLAMREAEAGRYRIVEPVEATDARQLAVQEAHPHPPPKNEPAAIAGESVAAPSQINEAASQGINQFDRTQVSAMRAAFDTQYYLTNYPELSDSTIDPFSHYLNIGWREGRNPSSDFDTRYYLETNADVARAGVNPFWHFIVAGRSEGRKPRLPGGARRRILEAVKTPSDRANGYSEPTTKRSPSKVVLAAIKNKIGTAKGVCVSISHDCYVRVIGGTQIFISDEQRKFSEAGYIYIHLSPLRPRLDTNPGPGAFNVHVVGDGAYLGAASFVSVMRTLSAMIAPTSADRLMIVHSILGFSPRHVIALRAAIKPRRSAFWLHDYTSLCEGFNLLRNDLDYCHAPPPQSQVCRICVYGASRREHLARVEEMFLNCDFDVLSPSAFTLDLWSSRSSVRVRSAQVHPHWRLNRKIVRQSSRDNEREPAPVRFAFVGFPSPGKGWHLFSDLYGKFRNDVRYEFLQFAASGVATLPGCTHVITEVTPTDRNATIRLLEMHKVDFVTALSPWPETFSFVAHEALAAGCQILCLADSGNIARLVAESGRGRVFTCPVDLEAFVRSGDAVRVALSGRGSGRRRYTVNACGTSAAVEGYRLLA